ncbi:hypothetical protein [Mycolicibacterium fallax]|uniref:hypothetical protein n=1 Tax=Mycolicibacterium fallax TaxID=1793 RepID=UPI00105498F2|nr:hypothetical protein [Mycolicibacterium fallax]BBY98359.1 hypothetical protein MFAL_18260 [Mycolicibacterium fallax]
MSNQIPTSWDTPAVTNAGDTSGVDSTAVNSLAGKLDGRATALRGVAGQGSGIATAARKKATESCRGKLPGDCDALFAKLDDVGAALKTAVDSLATSAETDATNLRTVVTGREHIEADTKKKLDNLQPGGTYI